MSREVESLVGVLPTVVTGGVVAGFVENFGSGRNAFGKGLLRNPYPSYDRSGHIGKTSVTYKGKKYRRYRAGYSPTDRRMQKEEHDPKYFACECGAEWGQYHELGCDCEDCPVCRGQLLSCGHGRLFETTNARCR